ncbi:hypothetical protein [Methylomonas lenta]|nr:hypothetical protein [Methylomonas lenta]
MKIRVLRTAMDDLAAGRLFYDKQQEGVGDYFLIVCLPKSIH